MLIRKFLAIQACLKKQEIHQVNNLTLHLKQLGKEKQKQKQKTKVTRTKEIRKIRAEITEKEMGSYSKDQQN